MTCDAARDALLIADLPFLAGDESELARHVRHCARCAALSRALTGDVATLRSSLRRRTAKRRRLAGAALTSAAAAVVWLAVRATKPVNRPEAAASRAPSAANVHPTNVVSVQVAPGKQATVFKTSDPTVTVVWLTDGGGL